MEICSPIKDKNIIEQIKQKYLERNLKRDLLLFLLSINTGIKLTELLKLRVCDIKNKDLLIIKEPNTKVFPLNKEIRELAKEYTENRKVKEPLFISVFGKPVDRVQVFRNFKEICVELGLEKEYSVSSWRKTFGYHYYQKYGDLAVLEWLFNQTTVTETMKYIDIQEDLNSHFNKEFCL
jgi:integrase